MNKKRLKLGYYYLIISAIVLAIVIFLNLIVGILPSRYTVYDTTGKDYYDFTDTTLDVIDSVKEKTEIILVAEEDIENAVLSELIGRYEQLNSNIEFDVIDPIVHPSYTADNGKEYDLSAQSSNTVIVTSEKREKIIKEDELYEMQFLSEEDYLYYMYYGVEPTEYLSYFIGEQMISSAIEHVNAPMPKVYFMEGHGETAVNTEMITEYLAEGDYTTASLSLIQEGLVPSDASCIIINDPQSDISDLEFTVLSEYVANGGDLILITDLLNKEDSFKNLLALASYYGMEYADGKLVEGDETRVDSESGMIMPYLNSSHAITSSFASYTLAMTPSTAFTVSEEVPSGATVTILVATSESAYIENDSGEKIFEGECVIGAIAEVQGVNYTENGTFAWYSSPSMADESGVYGGEYITLMNIGSVCEAETSLDIEGQDVTATTLTLDEGDVNFWSTMMTYALPLAVLLVGFAVWTVRRSRR